MSTTTRRGVGVLVGVWSGVLVLVATRVQPMMSPDSVTYLAASQHFREHGQLTDFTGKPMTVFGPLYPLLLSPGGASLQWARVIGAIAAMIATWSLFAILSHRVEPLIAIGASFAFGSSLGLIRVAATVWSEAPYIACSLLALKILASDEPTRKRVLSAGTLAGLGFLTRYAGIGLILTGGAVILAGRAQRSRRQTVVDGAWFLGAAIAAASFWVVRNLVRTGEALGPRFEGGATEPVSVLARRPFPALGQLVFGDHLTPDQLTTLGVGVVAVIVVGGAKFIRYRPQRPIDLAMALYGVTSIVIPVVARALTSNDIEYRVMSPTIVPVIYFLAVGAQRYRGKVIAAVGVTAIAWSSWHGVAMAQDFPHRLGASSASRAQFSSALYDAIDDLASSVLVLTNSPQRVWWQTRREPTLFAFTRPRAGNSHYPLDGEEMLRVVCLRETYLAWFDGLANAGKGPYERRADLTELINLAVHKSVVGGVLYRLTIRHEQDCAQFR